MNEWCAVWFWATDEESLRHVPTPETFHAGYFKARPSIIRYLAIDLKFFHWELEFPDVFTPDRSGFDALVGNPPWDVMKPNSQEFFSDFDPLYRTYDKQAAIRKQRELCDGTEQGNGASYEQDNGATGGGPAMSWEAGACNHAARHAMICGVTSGAGCGVATCPRSVLGRG